jgi:hypothetical protein
MAKQRNLLLAYLSVTTVLSTSLGGYVACGAQKYRVPVHGTEETSAPSRANTGSSSMAAKAAAKTGASANLVGTHSSQGWGKNLPIRFKVTDDMASATTDELKKAMGNWELAIGKKIFQFDGVEKKKGVDFKSLYSPLDDSQNGHYFDFNWAKATEKSNTVLATTIWENDPSDPNVIVKGDIRYNAEFYIFGDALKEFSVGKKTIVDMESLALHEVGHLLGLSHITENDDRYSVMNPSLFIGEGMMTRRLSEGDIERIRSVYGVGDATLAANLERANDFPTQ